MLKTKVKDIMLMRRCLSNSQFLRTNLSNFTAHKLGTGLGPFVELPDFNIVDDALVLKIPSFSTVFGKLDRIEMVCVPLSTESPFIRFTKLSTGFTRISTESQPVNMLCNTNVSMANVKIIEIDDYKKGWNLNDPDKHIICYSGDLSYSDNKMVGRGIIALLGQGPTFTLSLNDQESLLLACRSILGYEGSIKIKLQKLTSGICIPESIRKYSQRIFKGRCEKFTYALSNVINRDKIFYNVSGPGTVLIQTNYIERTASLPKDVPFI